MSIACRRTSLAPIAALALVASACGSELATSCPAAGERCQEPPAPSLRLGAELLRTGKSAPDIHDEVAPLEFDRHGAATVLLHRLARLSGQVRLDGVGAHAHLTATRPSLIPGRPDLYFHAQTDDKGRYELLLPPGGYTVRVVPLAPHDASAPPLQETLMVSASRDWSVELPSPSSLPVVTGRVVSALGAGLAGATVRAVDPATGVLRSSVAAVGASGDFQLRLARDVRPDDTVRVTAATAKPGDPQLSRDVVASAGDPVELRMPALPKALSFALPVTGKSTSGAVARVVGARVEFASDASAGAGGTVARFVSSVVTNEDGLAAVSLLPGGVDNRSYTVTVTPPTDSPYGKRSVMVQVGAAGGVLEAVLLDLRPQLVGRLLAPDGNPVRAAAVALGPADARPTAPGAAYPTTTTDPRGGFALRLDVGSYDVECIPPPSTKLARWSFDRTVQSDTDLGDVVIPHATLSHLAVLDADGAPAVGVEVRLYAVSYPAGCPVGQASCASPARLRGDATTDAQGGVSMLLPAP